MEQENLYVNNLSEAEKYVTQLHKKREYCVIGVDGEAMNKGLEELLRKPKRTKK